MSRFSWLKRPFVVPCWEKETNWMKLICTAGALLLFIGLRNSLQFFGASCESPFVEKIPTILTGCHQNTCYATCKCASANGGGFTRETFDSCGHTGDSVFNFVSLSAFATMLMKWCFRKLDTREPGVVESVGIRPVG